MRLVIVESPTKARKLSQYLSNDYTVKASIGHVRDLPKSKLGVNVDDSFEPTYVISPDKKDVITQLGKLAKKANSIYLATDPDREGEAIAWHVCEVLHDRDGLASSKFKRSVFHEITKPAVLKAIDKPQRLNMDLVDAQQARRVLDRLVGYQVSPVLWKKVRRGLSAGRVQSVALRLIVERERQIEAFDPKEYWELDVLLGVSDGAAGHQPTIIKQSTDIKQRTEQDDSAGKLAGKAGDKPTDGQTAKPDKPAWVDQPPASALVARVTHLNGRDYEPKAERQVTPVVKGLSGAKYRVQEVERKQRNRVSLPPFTTSTLQQNAASRLHMTTRQTMRLAQHLYEEGLITYHRTDSVSLAQQAVSMARNFIAQEYGQQFLPDQPRRFKSKSKNAQEAHEAIRVTNVKLGGEAVNQQGAKLTSRHAQLYDLIWRRFVASQMATAVYDQTTVTIQAEAGRSARASQPSSGGEQRSEYKSERRNEQKNEQGDEQGDEHKSEHSDRKTSGQKASRTQAFRSATLKATGSVLKFAGWMKLFRGSGDRVLPEVEADQPLFYRRLLAAQKFTQPPPRYNDASLVKELEKRGIGRPSTYASIISVIEDRGYVSRDQRRFTATPVGVTVSDFLLKHFADIMDYDFTAEMEEDLDRIARGEKDWQSIIKAFYQPLAKQIEHVEENADRAKIPVEKTGEKCPVCGQTEHGEVVIRSGKYGKFRSCSRFPDCDYTETIVEKLEGMNCPLCRQGDVIIKPSRWGKSFYGCSRYPECDWANWKQPKPGETITQAAWKKQQAERAERKKNRQKGKKKAGKKSKKQSKTRGKKKE